MEAGLVREETRHSYKVLDWMLFGLSVAIWIAWLLGRVSTRTALVWAVCALLGSIALLMILKVRGRAERPTSLLPLAGLAGVLCFEWIAFDGHGPRWLQALVVLIFFLTRFPALGSDGGGPSKPLDRRPRSY